MARHQTHRADNNQAEIVAAIEKAGAVVVSLSQVGRGVPDLLVGFRGKNWLLEVKGPTGKLNAAQREWHDDWPGQAVVVRSVIEAMETIGVVPKPQRRVIPQNPKPKGSTWMPGGRSEA